MKKIKQITSMEAALKTDFFTVSELNGLYSIYKNGKGILNTIEGLYAIELYQNKAFQKAFFFQCLTFNHASIKKIRLDKFVGNNLDHQHIRSHLSYLEQMALYSGVDAYKEALRSFILKYPSDYQDTQFETLFAKFTDGHSVETDDARFNILWKPIDIYVNRDNQGAYYNDTILFPFETIKQLVDAYSPYNLLYFIHFWRITKQEPSFFIEFLKTKNHLELFQEFLETLKNDESEQYIDNASPSFLEALIKLKVRIPHYDLVEGFGRDNDDEFYWTLIYHYDKQANRQRIHTLFKVGSFISSKYTKKAMILSALKNNYFFILEAMMETNFITKTTLLKAFESSSSAFSTQVRSFVLSHSEGVKLSSPAELAYNKQTKLMDEKTLIQAIEAHDIETVMLQLPLLDKTMIQRLSQKLYLFGFEENHQPILSFLKEKNIQLHRVKKTIESVIEYIAAFGSIESFKKAFQITAPLDHYTLSRLIEIAVERNEIEIGKIIFETYHFIPFTARAMGMAAYGGFPSWVELLIEHQGTILTRLKLTDSDFNTYKLIERSKGFEGPGNEYPAEFSCLAISDRFRYLGKYNPVENMKKGSEKNRLSCIQLLLKNKLYDDFSLGLIVTLAFHEEDLNIVDALLPFSPYILEKVRTVTKRSIGFSSLSKASRKILDNYIAHDEDKVVTESDLKYIVEFGE